MKKFKFFAFVPACMKEWIMCLTSITWLLLSHDCMSSALQGQPGCCCSWVNRNLKEIIFNKRADRLNCWTRTSLSVGTRAAASRFSHCHVDVGFFFFYGMWWISKVCFCCTFHDNILSYLNEESVFTLWTAAEAS